MDRAGEQKAGEWIFPPLDFLRSHVTKSVFASNDEIYRRSQALEEKLLNFGVEGRVTGVMPGPVVTMYEFEPAAGVRVNRIVNLSNDLAMAMKALSVRILPLFQGRQWWVSRFPIKIGKLCI